MKPDDSELTDTPLPLKGAATGGIIGGIIAAIIIIALVATAVILIRKQLKNKDTDGPPSHKPPPPMKHSKMSEMIVHTTMAEDPECETPLTYYETQKAEPVTDLDSYHSESADKMFDYSAFSDSDEKEIQPPYYDHRDMDRGVYGDKQLQPPSDLSREDSFVSAPMIV